MNFHKRFVPEEIYGMNVTCRLQDTFLSEELAESLICIFTLFLLSPRAFHLLSKTVSNETLSSIISYVYRLANVHSMFDSPEWCSSCLYILVPGEFFINCYPKANKKRCVLNNFVSQHKGLQGAIVRVCSQNQCFEFPLMCNQPTSQLERSDW